MVECFKSYLILKSSLFLFLILMNVYLVLAHITFFTSVRFNKVLYTIIIFNVLLYRFIHTVLQVVFVHFNVLLQFYEVQKFVSTIRSQEA